VKIEGCNFLHVPPMMSGSTGCGPNLIMMGYGSTAVAGVTAIPCGTYDIKKLIHDVLMAKKRGVTKYVYNMIPNNYRDCFTEWHEFLDVIYSEKEDMPLFINSELSTVRVIVKERLKKDF